ncbi:MAG: insulinase family protein [Chloroflexi bacterium]|nr:MAG: insulinase family protein [Chloroflexota bacterium]
MRTKPEHIGSFPGPHDVTRTVFANGLTVLVRENHAAPVAVLEGYLPVGALHDPVDKIGLSHYVAQMLTRGSANYNFDTFNEAIESIGANLNVASETHTLAVGVNSLSEDFPRMVEILADMLRRPMFPIEHMERVRQQKLVSIQERDQDTQRTANLRFYETTYPNHPYGRSIAGYKETVSAITHADLVDFYHEHYTPKGAILVLVGDVQTAAVLDLLEQHLGDWQGPAPHQSVPPAHTRPQVNRVTVPMPGKVQSDIVIGCPAPPRPHPDYFAVRVANTILGVFGMMGRLGERVREEQGLAYYCYSSHDAERDAGVWLAEAGVNPTDVPQAVDSILAEFDRLGSESVSEEELADSQAYMTGVLPLALETNAGVAARLLDMEWYGLGLDYLQRYKGLIERISVVDVQRVAQTYLRADNYTLVVAGPPTTES